MESSDKQTENLPLPYSQVIPLHLTTWATIDTAKATARKITTVSKDLSVAEKNHTMIFHKISCHCKVTILTCDDTDCYNIQWQQSKILNINLHFTTLKTLIS